MLTGLFKQTLTVSRPVSTTGIKSTYQFTGNAYPTMIQPLSNHSTHEMGMALGTAYHAYLSLSADIKTNDKVVDDAGLEYRVIGIKARKYGTQPHQTVYLELEPSR